MKDLSYYLGLPYTIVLKRDDEGDFVARVQELQGCTAHGATPQEAINRLEEEKKAWIEDSIEAGDEVPEPVGDEDALPSGKWLQRVPRSLHLKLARLAKREGTSLNTLVTGILAEAVGERWPQGAAKVVGPVEIAWCGEASNALGTDLNTHDAPWFGFGGFGPLLMSCKNFVYATGNLSSTVRTVAKHIPGKMTFDLKTARRDETTKKNIKYIGT